MQLSWILTPHKQLHEDRCDSHCPTQNEAPGLHTKHNMNKKLFMPCPRVATPTFSCHSHPLSVATPTRQHTDRDERLHTVGVAAETGHVYGEHAPRPPPHEVGPVAGQSLGDGGVAMASCNVEGSVVLFVLHIHTCT